MLIFRHYFIYMRRYGIVLIAILSFLFLSSCQPDKTLRPVKKAVGAVWIAEPNWDYIDFALQQNIILSAIFHITNVRTPDTDAWISFLKEAQSRGVKLRISPIVDGYGMYFSTTEAGPQLAVLSGFIDLLKAEGVQPCELILDAEGRGNELAQDFIKVIQSASVDSLKAFFNKVPTQAEHAAALQRYHDYISGLHREGWKVGITTLDIVSVDQLDHDNDLERFFDIPLRGVGWDFITYQVYRAGSVKTSYYVYRIAKLGHDEFGDIAGVDIGIMGVNQLPEGGDYHSFPEWRQDVLATRAAGINPDLVVGFRLELVNTPKDNMARWFEETDASPVPAPPKAEVFSDASIASLILADKVLDGIL